MKLAFYLRYAVRSLRREGQRTLLAVLCIAFGVASLAALSLLATATREAIITDPRSELGGDLLLERAALDPAAAEAALDRAQAEGVIERWTAIGSRDHLLLRVNDDGATHFLGRLLAVEPTRYPIVGTLELQGGGTLAEALGAADSALITRDLVAKRGIRLGDEITLVSQEGSLPLRLRVTGIVETMPDRRGDTVIVSQRQVAGTGLFSGRLALVTLGPQGTGLASAPCAGGDGPPLCESWQIAQRAEREPSGQAVADLFDLMLSGAGLLGLLVGGIGIANTLQVLLARRRGDLAILAAVGYPRRDLIALVAVETALIGALGSAVGVVGAIALFYPLTALLGRTEGSIMLERSVALAPLLSGAAAAGIVTALIFGLAASVQASAVRPTALFRGGPIALPRRSWLATGGLWLLLAALFAALSALILRSPPAGVGVVLLAAVGLIALGSLFTLLLKGLVRLPLPTGTLLSLAQHNLRRQGLRPIFALIALWAGLFAVGFAGNSILNAERRVSQQPSGARGELVVIAPLADEGALRAQLPEAAPRLRALVQVAEEGSPTRPFVLEGRADGEGAALEGEPWGAEGLYVSQTVRPWWGEQRGQPIQIGTTVRVSLASGEIVPLRVAGFFMPSEREQRSVLLPPDFILPEAQARALIGPSGMVVVSEGVAAEQLAPLSQRLNGALPNAFTYTSDDQRAALMRALRGLFGFVVMVASLALVAGAVLIANAVALALVERRREAGILKAVGFSSGHLLRLLLLENLLLGLLGGAAGLATLVAATALINRAQPAARLVVSPAVALTLLAVGLLVALGSTVAVAWQPARQRPLALLRER